MKLTTSTERFLQHLLASEEYYTLFRRHYAKLRFHTNPESRKPQPSRAPQSSCLYYSLVSLKPCCNGQLQISSLALWSISDMILIRRICSNGSDHQYTSYRHRTVVLRFRSLYTPRVTLLAFLACSKKRPGQLHHCSLHNSRSRCC